MRSALSAGCSSSGLYITTTGVIIDLSQVAGKQLTSKQSFTTAHRLKVTDSFFKTSFGIPSKPTALLHFIFEHFFVRNIFV